MEQVESAKYHRQLLLMLSPTSLMMQPVRSHTQVQRGLTYTSMFVVIGRHQLKERSENLIMRILIFPKGTC